MCGRASLGVTKEELESRFGAILHWEDLENFHPFPNFNMAPSQRLPVITDADPYRIQLFRWGLTPSWVKEEKTIPFLINARSETVAERPAFQQSFLRRRCLWPVDGYYEWIKVGKDRLPYHVFMPSTSIFTVAGLWDVWKNEAAEEIHSFTILTRSADPTMEFLHSRMPVILPQNLENDWLNSETDPHELLNELPSIGLGTLKVYRVSGKVNQVKNNSSDLIQEIPDVKQGTLF